ncbi:hypothetical protein CBS101457_000155 [Exobasidium rhododendri]|nr:hypothetical protein CBS101457_000155 [Exobasidium rhododendri]
MAAPSPFPAPMNDGGGGHSWLNVDLAHREERPSRIRLGSAGREYPEAQTSRPTRQFFPEADMPRTARASSSGASSRSGTSRRKNKGVLASSAATYDTLLEQHDQYANLRNDHQELPEYRSSAFSGEGSGLTRDFLADFDSVQGSYQHELDHPFYQHSFGHQGAVGYGHGAIQYSHPGYTHPTQYPSHRNDILDGFPVSLYPQHNSNTGDNMDAQRDPQQQQAAPIIPEDEAQVEASFIRPHNVFWNYTVFADSRIPNDQEYTSVYRMLNRDQRLVITELIHSTRPYAAHYLQRELKRLLRSQDAADLLSNDETLIEAAIKRMYPPEGKNAKRYIPWTKGLNSRQRFQVIDKLSEATLQSSTALRDHLLEIQASPDLGKAILDAADLEAVRKIAVKYQLYSPKEEKGVLPWQRGTSVIQRRSLLQRFAAAGIDEGHAYLLLQKAKVTPGYGLKMLKTSEIQFAIALGSLQDRKAPLFDLF